MRRLGLRGVMRGKVVRTTISDAKAPCPLDRVNRQFRAERPNQLWVSDFTYISTWQGWLYVAFVVDVFARRIVGWRVSSSMRTDFVLDALEQALYARQPERDGSLVCHSDRGSQGVFNRSSQHRVVERILGTGSKSRPVSSSPAFYAACWSESSLPRSHVNDCHSVGADPNLSHRADRILSQGWGPAFRGPAVDKCRSVLAL
jgi:hypothetical protein